MPREPGALEGCSHEGLARLPELLARALGVEVRVGRGRFRGEFNLSIGRGGSHIATLKVFCGWGPYRGWVEVFDVDPNAFLEVEGELYKTISGALRPGEPFYVDYSWDPETLKLLDASVPVVATRIGLKLVEAGFTWFKLWYYPEGFMEGNVKIQAEKPVGEDARLRHVREICGELGGFLEAWAGKEASRELQGALERALRLGEALGCRG